VDFSTLYLRAPDVDCFYRLDLFAIQRKLPNGVVTAAINDVRCLHTDAADSFLMAAKNGEQQSIV